MSKQFKVKFTFRSEGDSHFAHKTEPLTYPVGRTYAEGSVYSEIEAKQTKRELLEEFNCDVELVPFPPEGGGRASL